MSDKIIEGGLTAESLDRFHRIEARSFARYGHCLFEKYDKGEAEERYVSRLAAHIREYLTIRDIIDFNGYADFICRINYLSTNKHVRTLDWVGKDWRITNAGYVADTAEKQRAIIRLFAEIEREAIFFIGIRMYAEKCATTPPHLWDQFNADADEESPLDMTLNALIRSCPANAERCLNDLKDMEKRICARIDAQGADVKRGADAAERAEKAATEMRDPALACFEKMSARDKSKYGPRASKTRDPLLKAKDHAVCEKWTEFSTGEADPELPDGTFRRASGRRDLDEFFAAYHDTIVFNGKTLGELYPDAEGGIESMRQAIERERKRRARAEESAKATPPCPPPKR